jgi:FMN phosphatase YigB (HAD superfamily)
VVSPFQAILDYELSHSIPPGWINNCISKTKPYGYWHRLERGEMLMNANWFAGFTRDLHQPSLWAEFYTSVRAGEPSLPASTPPVPTVDGEALFWEMMRASRDPDPWMYPALQKLKASGKYILAGLSNTMIFPPGHAYRAHSNDGVRGIFDVFISSAHVGMRKPDAAIYDYAIRELDSYAKANPGKGAPDGVKAGDILFLDDIGENLKAAKTKGFRTIKVNLGRAFEAVDQLEDVTGLKLAGVHPRIAVTPKISKTKL